MRKEEAIYIDTSKVHGPSKTGTQFTNKLHFHKSFYPELSHNFANLSKDTASGSCSPSAGFKIRGDIMIRLGKGLKVQLAVLVTMGASNVASHAIALKPGYRGSFRRSHEKWRIARLQYVLALTLLMFGAAIGPRVAAQTVDAKASTTAPSDILPPEVVARYTHARWIYPKMEDIYVEGQEFNADLVVDCGVQTSGHVTDCYVTSSNPQDKPETEDAVAAAYLRVATVAPDSVDGGIKDGDRAEFHYMWHDLPHSDLSDAARLPSISTTQDQGGQDNTWHYPLSGLMASYYPSKASGQMVEGLVILYCEAKSDGKLKHCLALVEYPKNYGFGDATAAAFEKYAFVTSPPGGSVQDGNYKLFTYKWLLH